MRTDSRPHLFHVFSTFAVGGPQTRFVALADAFQDKYRHTVLAMDADFSAANLLDRNVDCSFVAIPVAKSRGISLANVRSARRLLRQVQPDVLLTYNWGTIEWSVANFFRPLCPQLHLEDGFGSEESPQRQARRRVLMRRLVLSRCRAVIVPSQTLLKLATETWRLPGEQVKHVPNGIACERFDRPADPALLAELRIPLSRPVVGTVAGLRPEKNLMRLLRVFAAMPGDMNAVLVIVGDGPLRQSLTDAATRLGIADRLVMTGTIPHPEQIIGRFDVFALTSDTEQMPNSIIEAMAAGIPVVATDVGDVKRVLATENRPFVVPCDDEAGLVGRLVTLLGDPGLRRRIGSQNKEHVKRNYSFDLMLARHDAMISTLVRS